MPVPGTKALGGRVDVDAMLREGGDIKITSKPYFCTNCGHKSMRSTNHYGSCFPARCVKCRVTSSRHEFDHQQAMVLLANEGKEPGDG